MVLLSARLAALDPPAGDLFERLAADAYETRGKAQKELHDWAFRAPDQAVGMLYQWSRSRPDPEVRRRCLAVLHELVDLEFSRGGQGYVGIFMQTVPVQVPGDARARFGIRVNQLVKGSPAVRAGLMVGDVITGMGDATWIQPDAHQDFSDRVGALKPGNKVLLHVLRNQQKLDVTVELARRAQDANNLLPMQLGGPLPDPELSLRREREEYFRKWLAERKARG